jgi:hypothetical protein
MPRYLRPSLILFCFLLLSACDRKTKNQFVFAELSPQDSQRLDQQRAVIKGAAQARYGPTAILTGTKADVPLLQRMIDNRVFAKDQTYQLQSLGVAFGDVLASETGMHWVIVSDQYGTDPTLRYKNSSIQLNALTMISKRVEEGQPVNLSVLLQGCKNQVQQMIQAGRYD